jgi:hypothetical protein
MNRKISQLTFLFKGFIQKPSFQSVFDDNLRVTHSFIKQTIRGLQRRYLPSHSQLPQSAVQGVG